MLGRVVDGRYRDRSSAIGAGGMGVVYRVEHLAMGKIAAMKVLHPALARRPPRWCARFEREARGGVAARRTRNTVQVFDFGDARRARCTW